MEPVQALASATAEPAAYWGFEDRGWVAEGYRADLLVVRGDPSVDIDATTDIRWVLLAGEVWEPEALAAADALLQQDKAPLGGFCLDERDCAEGTCDLMRHECASSCSPVYATVGTCDADSWCSPVDGLGTTVDGSCYPEDDCDLYRQDCEPLAYVKNCVPMDMDSNCCLPSGARAAGQSCSYTDSAYFCAQGLFCSRIDYHCYALCDPDGPDSCLVGRCFRQVADDGSPWFGLCL